MDLFCSVRRIIDNKIVIADIFGVLYSRQGELNTIQIGSMVINLQTEGYNVSYADVYFPSKETAEKQLENQLETFIPRIKRTLNVG
ncbi:MAG: hypothetical protein J6C46_11085 [Clostridia bacterium]|nr:hypothetical protein [Clostridia bacterium]